MKFCLYYRFRITTNFGHPNMSHHYSTLLLNLPYWCISWKTYLQKGETSQFYLKWLSNPITMTKKVILFGKCWTRPLRMSKQSSIGVLIKRCSANVPYICMRTPMPKCDLSKPALRLHWNHTWAKMFSCKFTVYF